MLLTFVCLITAAAAHPLSVHYDRRQDGELNVSADLQNILVLVAVPDKSASHDLFDFLKTKGQTRHHEAQERADHVMDAFVEPDTPYQVEIGSDRSANGGGAGEVEIVIAGRRRLETEPQDDGSDEIKLIGATEQCGPDRERNPVTLVCQLKKLDVVDDKPASASQNSIQKPAKESSIQKEPAKENFVQKDAAKEGVIQKEEAKKSEIHEKPLKESQILKELTKESSKSKHEVEKLQTTPQVIHS